MRWALALMAAAALVPRASAAQEIGARQMSPFLEKSYIFTPAGR